MAKQILRFFQMFMLVLAGTSLAVNNQEVFAARNAAKSHKAGRKGKAAAGSGEVWSRVRQGLRISVLGPPYEGADALIAAAANPVTSKTGPGIMVASNEDNSGLSLSQTDNPARLTTVISANGLFKNGSQLPENLRDKQIINPKNSRLFKNNLNPEEKYTALGRLKLAPKAPVSAEKTGKNRAEQCLFKKFSQIAAH